MAAVGRGHAGDVGIGGGNHLHGGAVDMADSVCPGPHGGGGAARGGGIGAHDTILPSPASARRHSTSALTAVARASRRGRCLVQLLLVSQQQITASKAPRALGTLKRLFLGVGTLVAFQVLEAGEGTLTSAADVGTRLVGLGRREGGRCLGVDHDGRGCEAEKDLISHTFSLSSAERRQTIQHSECPGVFWRVRERVGGWAHTSLVARGRIAGSAGGRRRIGHGSSRLELDVSVARHSHGFESGIF